MFVAPQEEGVLALGQRHSALGLSAKQEAGQPALQQHQAVVSAFQGGSQGESKTGRGRLGLGGGRGGGNLCC